MPTTIATIQINAPAQEVYPFLVMPNLISAWVEGLRPGMLVGGDSEIAIGLRPGDIPSARDMRADPHDETFTFEPDLSASLKITSAGFILVTRFHLFESDGVTTLRQSVHLQYRRWHRVFARMTRNSVEKRMERSLRMLKERVESDGYPEEKMSA